MKRVVIILNKFHCTGTLIIVFAAILIPFDINSTIRAERFDSTNFDSEKEKVLEEVVVSAKTGPVLHLLGIIRDHSTLSSYSDTVRMYREKLVDFMVPIRKTGNFKGWLSPRLLSSKSYYRLTSSSGLDSVTDRFNQHFSYSDWIEIFKHRPIPTQTNEIHDSIRQSSTTSQVWRKSEDEIKGEVNIVCDSSNWSYLPKMRSYFKDRVDFERLRINYSFGNVLADSLFAIDLDKAVFDIESCGRRRNMFRFNHKDEPVFVATRAELFIIDREFISIKEARRWEKITDNEEYLDLISFSYPLPPLENDTRQLIARVEDIDERAVRLSLKPDEKIGNRTTRLRSTSLTGKVLKAFRKLLKF